MADAMKRLLCWILRGHNERRLRKGEVLHPTPEVLEMVGRNDGLPDAKSVRICTRCGATRLAKKRKSKAMGAASDGA